MNRQKKKGLTHYELKSILLTGIVTFTKFIMKEMNSAIVCKSSTRLCHSWFEGCIVSNHTVEGKRNGLSVSYTLKIH